MKQNEKSLFYNYILNNRLRLEDNVRNIQANIRFRRVDIIDCVELIEATVELETFKQVTNDLRLLLDIELPSDV